MSQFPDLLRRFLYHPEEEVSPALAEPPTVAAPAPASEEPEEFLAFALEGEVYAVPIASVREIMRVPPVTELPRAPASVVGLINVRGEMLPLYDIKVRLRLTSGTGAEALGRVSRASRVVLVRDLAGDAGVLADRVLGVVKLPLSSLESPPQLGQDRQAIAGLARRDGTLFILLDVEQVLA